MCERGVIGPQPQRLYLLFAIRSGNAVPSHTYQPRANSAYYPRASDAHAAIHGPQAQISGGVLSQNFLGTPIMNSQKLIPPGDRRASLDDWACPELWIPMLSHAKTNEHHLHPCMYPKWRSLNCLKLNKVNQSPPVPRPAEARHVLQIDLQN